MAFKRIIEYSEDQIGVFEEVKKGINNIAIKACPGSGKTTTLLECLKFIDSSKSILFLSFSGEIVEELKKKIPPYVNCSTIHSLGNSSFKDNGKKVMLNGNKYTTILVELLGKDKFKKGFWQRIRNISDIISYIKLTLCNLDIESVSDMCDMYNIPFTKNDIEIAIEQVEKIKTINFSEIDFTDMIYIPYIKEYKVKKYDYIFLDESQDCSVLQLELIKRHLKKTSILISAGDPRQSIYSFNGSDPKSYWKLLDIPKTVERPLSISYRCPVSVVEEAQKIYPEMKPYSKSPIGVVSNSSIDNILPGDLVLSRISKPLLEIYFYLIDKEIKSTIVGKEIEAGLLKTYKTFSHLRSIPAAKNFLDDKLLDIEERLIKAGYAKPQKVPEYIEFEEKVQLMDVLFQKANKVQEIEQKIKELFDKKKDSVTLMTIHKSKGLENNRVFLLTHFKAESLMPYKRAKQEWEFIQENNIKYVGITRAKKELHYFQF